LAINSTTIFFTEESAQKHDIYSCPKAGCASPTTIIPSSVILEGIAANDRYLYWATASTVNFQPSTQNRCSVSNCTATATVLYSEGFSTSVGTPIPAAPPVADATNVYFAVGIHRDSCSGCGSNPPNDSIYSIAPTPAGVFWLNQTAVQGPGFSYSNDG